MASHEIYFCEEVSSIEVKGDVFYLTDRSGDSEICRAMSYPTFARCVRGASALLDKFEATRGDNIVAGPGH